MTDFVPCRNDALGVERMLPVTALPYKPDWHPVEDDEPPTGTVQQLLDWVGDDLARARAVLDRERAAADPRTTLIEPLQHLLDD